jgi:hypothetical protein
MPDFTVKHFYGKVVFRHGLLSASGMKLYVYTVNSPEDARKLANLGVAGITTDRPAYLRSEMEGASK